MPRKPTLTPHPDFPMPYPGQVLADDLAASGWVSAGALSTISSRASPRLQPLRRCVWKRS